MEFFGPGEVIEVIGFVNKGECRGAGFLSFPGTGLIRVAAPDRVESGEEEVLALVVDGGAIVVKV